MAVFQVIGIVLLFCIIGVPALLALLEWKKPSSSERKNMFYRLLLEQEDNVLKEVLRKSARKKLTAEMQSRIRDELWEECFDVAEDLIEASATPAITEQEQVKTHILQQ